MSEALSLAEIERLLEKLDAADDELQVRLARDRAVGLARHLIRRIEELERQADPASASQGDPPPQSRFAARAVSSLRR